MCTADKRTRSPLSNRRACITLLLSSIAGLTTVKLIKQFGMPPPAAQQKSMSGASTATETALQAEAQGSAELQSLVGWFFMRYNTDCWWYEIFRMLHRVAIALIAADPLGWLTTDSQSFLVGLLLLFGLGMQLNFLPYKGTGGGKAEPVDKGKCRTVTRNFDDGAGAYHIALTIPVQDTGGASPEQQQQTEQQRQEQQSVRQCTFTDGLDSKLQAVQWGLLFVPFALGLKKSAEGAWVSVHNSCSVWFAVMQFALFAALVARFATKAAAPAATTAAAAATAAEPGTAPAQDTSAQVTTACYQRMHVLLCTSSVWRRVTTSSVWRRLAAVCVLGCAVAPAMMARSGAQAAAADTAGVIEVVLVLGSFGWSMHAVYKHVMQRMLAPVQFYKKKMLEYHDVLCAEADPEEYMSRASTSLDLAADAAQHVAHVRAEGALSTLVRLDAEPSPVDTFRKGNCPQRKVLV